MNALSDPDEEPLRPRPRPPLAALASRLVAASSPVVGPTIPADAVVGIILFATGLVMTLASLAGWADARPPFFLVGWAAFHTMASRTWVVDLAVALVVFESGRALRRILVRWVDTETLAVAWLGWVTALIVLTPPIWAAALLDANLVAWGVIPASLAVAAVKRHTRRAGADGMK